MRLVCISDTHNLHWGLNNIPDGDVLIHAGDCTNIGYMSDLLSFNVWFGKFPHKKKLLIAGNHDWCFVKYSDIVRDALSSALYLEDESIRYKKINFYGTPWQPEFYNWAFNLPRGGALAEKWKLIPDNTDVLIVHGPPKGILDQTKEGDRTGCEELLKAVNRVKPALVIFGHIHEAYGAYVTEDTLFVNVSTCDRSYKLVNKPVVVDLVVENGKVKAKLVN